MRLLPRFVLTFAIGIAGSLSLAADKVELAHKPDLKPGTTTRDVTDTTLEQTLTLAGMNIETAVESHSATQSTVTEQLSDGKTKLRSNFEYFIVSMDMPMIGKIEFDSSKTADNPNVPDQLRPVMDMFRAVSKTEWESVLNSKPELESVAFVGNPFEGLDQSVATDVTPERFKVEHNNRMRRYPDGPVAVGDKWERTEDVAVSGGQKLTFKKEFTYLGTEEKSGTTFDKIGVKSLTVDYSLGSDPKIPLKLEESKLEIAASEGVLLYDRTLKMITSEKETLQIKGPLTFSFEINGKAQKLPGELDLTIGVEQKSEPVKN
jgi:hypothetical protein